MNKIIKINLLIAVLLRPIRLFIGKLIVCKCSTHDQSFLSDLSLAVVQNL